MSFSIPFFRRKSVAEQSVSRSTKSVSSQRSLSRDVSTSQGNGDLTSNDSGYVMSSKNSSPSKQAKMKTPFIYIESSEAAAAELAGPSPESNPPPRSSRLSKTLDQVLRDRDALPHFIQFMESHDASNLVKFWLDAETFKVTSITRMTSDPSSIPLHPNPTIQGTEKDGNDPSLLVNTPNADPHNSTIPCTSTPVEKRLQGHPGSVTAHGHEQFPQNSPSNSPTSVPKIPCESASLASAREPNAAATSSAHFIPIGNSSGPSDVADRGEHVLPSVGSLSHSSADVASEAGLEKSSGSNLSGPSGGVPPSEDVCDDEATFQRNLRKSIENDAIVIFSKYLSPDCSQPIEISDDLRAQTIGRICHEDGTVDPSCFEKCQQYVFGRMETRYFSDFLQSVFYIKHQIDILSQLQLVDILYNDTALSYFTEFMEEEKILSLLQCFLDLDSFQHHLLSQGEEYDGNEAQNDAMIIYDKYISMQATQTVRFDDRVRLRVESNICREAGPLPDCFQLPLQLVLQRMQQAYYPLFTKSEIYTKYVTDLLNTSHLMQDSIGYRRKRTGSDASSEKSAGNLSTGNESVSSKNTYLARDTSGGQQFAKAINKFGDNMRIDSSLLNPDILWHRPNAGRMKFGKVTELGQFVSDFDPDPDHNKKKLAPFFTASKRREKEKSEEDQAWQVAQKIIDDVMSATNDDSSPPDGDLPAGNS